MPVVHFVKQERSIECPVGTNIRRLALDNRIDLYALPFNLFHCRGFGLCGTCRIMVDNPRTLSAPSPAEHRKTLWEGPQYRLACQSQVLADVSVVTNPRKVYGWSNHDTYAWLKKQQY